MLTAVVGLTVCFTLFGCDQNPQQAQTVAATPVAVAPPPPCNCRQAGIAPIVRVARHRVDHRRYGYFARYEHHDHHGHHGHTLSEFLAYSTRTSSNSANEGSPVREYRPGDEQRYDEQRYTESGNSGMNSGGARDQQGTSTEAAWVDGYGRAHYADYGPIEDEHPGLISARDEHERAKPRRGYDSKCNNRID
jgi:hypothetical protein